MSAAASQHSGTNKGGAGAIISMAKEMVREEEEEEEETTDAEDPWKEVGRDNRARFGRNASPQHTSEPLQFPLDLSTSQEDCACKFSGSARRFREGRLIQSSPLVPTTPLQKVDVRRVGDYSAAEKEAMALLVKKMVKRLAYKAVQNEVACKYPT